MKVVFINSNCWLSYSFIIFNWKHSSSKNLFFMTQWYTCIGNLLMEIPVLQSLMCWSIILLKPQYYRQSFLQYTFLYGYTYYTVETLMSLQVTCEQSSHLILLGIIKLLFWFTYNEQILQRLSVHLNTFWLHKIFGVSTKSSFRWKTE